MITKCIFSNSFKISKINPLFKKDDVSVLSNYRLVLLLPTISKIFGRILYNQLHDYFNSNNLLAEQHYGFHTSHSTEYAEVKLVDIVSEEMELGNKPASLYVALSKAFDYYYHLKSDCIS